MERRELEAASKYAERWLRVAPDPAQPRALLRQLEVLRRYGAAGTRMVTSVVPITSPSVVDTSM